MRSRKIGRERRKKHVRKNLYGTAYKPRVFIFKSNKYVYAGIANDEAGTVLTSCFKPKKMKEMEILASCIAKFLSGKKIATVVFDRSGYKYHGLIKTFVESLRKNKIKV
jgi:large subunit ribosomal protein L18